MKLVKSKKIFSRLKKSLPGGVNSPVRAFNSVDSFPLIIKSGKGSVIIDEDDNSYIDFVGSWGPLILGHANPNVISKIIDTIRNGTSFGNSTKLEAELAELVIKAFPSIDLIRFVNSGTEATMSAIRLARAYTNKKIIIKFEGCYHGHGDSFLSKSGSGIAELDESISRGVSNLVISETITLPYNDINSVETIFNLNKNDIAAIIVEPIAGNMGVILPENNFLENLRMITEKYNSLLIFDEVISGFRVDYGGAQTLYNVNPDITCLGKIIGGGLPVGAYGGKYEIMKMVAPLGQVYQAGTLSGNPVAMSAGIATLKILKSGHIYTELEKKGAYLEKTIVQEFIKKKIKIKFSRCGSMFGIFFSSIKIKNWSDVQLSDINFYKMFHSKMLEHGIYLPPSPYESFFISVSHSQKDLDRFVDVIKKL